MNLGNILSYIGIGFVLFFVFGLALYNLLDDSYQKESCLDSYVIMTEIVLPNYQELNVDRVTFEYFAFWWMQHCSDFDYSEQEYIEKAELYKKMYAEGKLKIEQ